MSDQARITVTFEEPQTSPLFNIPPTTYEAIFKKPPPTRPTTVGGLRGSRWLGEMELERFKRNIKALEYIENVGNSLQAGITNWPLELFLHGDDLFTDKRAVNMIISTEMDKRAASEQAERDRMRANVLSKTEQFEKQIQAEALRKAQTDLGAHRRSASDHYTTYQEHVKQAWQKQVLIEKLESRKSLGLVKEMEQILASKFWEFHGYGTKTIQFRNKEDIILIYNNRKSGENFRVNLGRFTVTLHPIEAKVEIMPTGNNLYVSGHYHPYLNCPQICWGRAEHQVIDHLAAGEFGAVMELLASLLSQYHPDATPYIGIENFQREENRRPKNGASPPSEEQEVCDFCECLVDDCSCWTCEICEDRFTDGDGCECCQQCRSISSECDCCVECNRTYEDCTRCRECEAHEGHEHAANCPTLVGDEDTEE
jgi:hypothetical protein